MPHNSFSAIEVAAIASAVGVEKVYGFPNISDGLPEGEQIACLQNAVDDLIRKHIIKMDFDGNTELDAEYADIFSVIFACKKCLTVNLQDGSNGARAFIFWKTENESLVMAEAIEGKYVFSNSDGFFLKSLIASFPFKPTVGSMTNLVIPGISLTKAKRACDEQRHDDAARLLRQAGADESVAGALVEGLCCRAEVVSTVLIEPELGDHVTEHTYLQTNRGLFSVGEKKVNLRTCAEIAAVDIGTAKASVEQLIDSFLS